MTIATDRTIVEKQVVHEDSWVKATTVDVCFNNGKTLQNFLMLEPKSKEFISVCVRLSDGRFIFTRQCKPISGMSIESVQGSCDNGKGETETVIKEMTEEIGYAPGKLVRVNPFGFFTQTDRINNRCHLFLAFDCVPANKILVQDEVQGVETLILTPEEVWREIASGKIKDLATIAGIFAHFMKDDGKFGSIPL